VSTSCNAPTTIHRYDVAANTSTVWAAPAVEAGLDRIVVEQGFHASKDGVRVPMFLIRRSDLNGPAPTLLHGYGAFGISMVPYFEPSLLAWIEQGGIVAIPNIRGGGEYGKAWHDAARFDHKQASSTISSPPPSTCMPRASSRGTAWSRTVNPAAACWSAWSSTSARPCSRPPCPASAEWTCCASTASPAGACGSANMALEEMAGKWAFAAHWAGLEVKWW